MVMWVVILALALALCLMVAAMVYLVRRFSRFGIVEKLSRGSRRRKYLLGSVPILAFAVYGIFDLMNMIVVVLHLAVFWLLGDLVTWIVRRLRKKFGKPAKPAGRIYWQGILVLTTCAVYLTVGWYLAHCVVRTEYRLTTEKPLPGGSLRIVQIADCHIGATFDGQGFRAHLKEIQKEAPDLLVVTGDLVDDDTSHRDLLEACRALGEVETTYGTYFVYGNHDKGYYSGKDYTAQQLETALEDNGITILEDQTVLIDDSFYLIGRMDRSEHQRGELTGEGSSVPRMTMEEITQGLDKSRYMIVLDHQPNDYAAQAQSQVDLVLSGHTHGGQLIPLGPIGRLIGANDSTYGRQTRGNTEFIVTSGISNWALHFKTGAVAEYVVIDIVEK